MSEEQQQQRAVIVRDGVIENVIVFDPEADFKAPRGTKLELVEEDAGYSVGDRYPRPVE